jgi:uncharacterized protein (TIGR03435 family)
MTDLKGYYRVSFEVPAPKGSSSANGELLGRSDDSAERSVVSIFASVQTLGLKLEKRKLPIEHVVIDHLEKVPVGN